MINPNREYKAPGLAQVVAIQDLNRYIPYITIMDAAGRMYEGDLKRSHPQWYRIKLGDTVGFKVRWSITADKPLISTLIRKRA